jgi:hypothetical protein
LIIVIDLPERLFADHDSPCSVQSGYVVTSKADEYRAKASEAEQLAEQTVDSVIKEKLFKIAQQWRDMAAYEESTGARPP